MLGAAKFIMFIADPSIDLSIPTGRKLRQSRVRWKQAHGSILRHELKVCKLGRIQQEPRGRLAQTAVSGFSHLQT